MSSEARRAHWREPLTRFVIRRAGMAETSNTPKSLRVFWESQGWLRTNGTGTGRLALARAGRKDQRAWARLLDHNRVLADWLYSERGLRAPRHWPAAVDEEWRAYGVDLSPVQFARGCFPSVGRPERKYGRWVGVPELAGLAHGFDLEDEEMERAVDGVRQLCEDIPFVVYACRPDFRGVALPTGGESLMSRLIERDAFLRCPMSRSMKQWHQALNPRLWTSYRLRKLPRLPWVPCSTYTPVERSLVEAGAMGWQRVSTPDMTY